MASEPVVHMRPRQGERIVPCCGADALDVDAVTSNLADVTCPGSQRQPDPREFLGAIADAIAGDPTADGFVFGMTSDGHVQPLGSLPSRRPRRPEPDEGPQDPTANPEHGEPGHRCVELPDSIVMDLNAAATKIVDMVVLHRNRLVEAGVAEEVANVMAAQYHAMLLAKTF